MHPILPWSPNDFTAFMKGQSPSRILVALFFKLEESQGEVGDKCSNPAYRYADTLNGTEI